MGSIGWYILGYFALGMVSWVLGAIALVIAAAINDIRWDLKNDPSMERVDTTESLRDTALNMAEHFDDQCQITEKPQNTRMTLVLKGLIFWPYTMPKGYSMLWKLAVDLREQKRR